MPPPQATLQRFQIDWRAAGTALGTVGRDLGAEEHAEAGVADTSIAAGDTHPLRPALAAGLAPITRIVVHQRIEIDADVPWDQIGRRRADADAPEIVRAEELFGFAVGAEVGCWATARLARSDKLVADFFDLADLGGPVAADLIAVDSVRPWAEAEAVDTFESDRTPFRDAALPLVAAPSTTRASPGQAIGSGGLDLAQCPLPSQA